MCVLLDIYASGNNTAQEMRLLHAAGQAFGRARARTDIPAPSAEHADDFWRHGCSERDPEEDEGFVDGVGESELGPDGCDDGRDVSKY